LNKYKNLLPERAVTELIPNEPKTVHVYDSKVSPFDGDKWLNKGRWVVKKREMCGYVRSWVA